LALFLFVLLLVVVVLVVISSLVGWCSREGVLDEDHDQEVRRSHSLMDILCVLEVAAVID